MPTFNEDTEKYEFLREEKKHMLETATQKAEELAKSLPDDEKQLRIIKNGITQRVINEYKELIKSDNFNEQQKDQLSQKINHLSISLSANDHASLSGSSVNILYSQSFESEPSQKEINQIAELITIIRYGESIEYKLGEIIAKQREQEQKSPITSSDFLSQTPKPQKKEEMKFTYGNYFKTSNKGMDKGAQHDTTKISATDRYEEIAIKLISTMRNLLDDSTDLLDNEGQTIRKPYFTEKAREGIRNDYMDLLSGKTKIKQIPSRFITEGKYETELGVREIKFWDEISSAMGEAKILSGQHKAIEPDPSILKSIDDLLNKAGHVTESNKSTPRGTIISIPEEPRSKSKKNDTADDQVLSQDKTHRNTRHTP